jgi:predicted nucleotidyltransferase
MMTRTANAGWTPARERAIDELRRMVLRAVGEHDAAIWLFGSSARQNARQDSDIDIGVLPTDDLPAAVLAELAADIEDSDIPYDVDLFDLRYVEPALLAAVRREGVPWRK